MKYYARKTGKFYAYRRRRSYWKYKGLSRYNTKPKGHYHFITVGDIRVTSSIAGIVQTYIDLGNVLVNAGQYTSLSGVYKRVKIVGCKVKWLNTFPTVLAANDVAPIAIGYNPQAVLGNPSSQQSVTDNDSHIIVSAYDTTWKQLSFYPKVLANTPVDEDGFFQLSTSTGPNIGMVQIYQGSAIQWNNLIGHIQIEFTLKCTYDS